MMRAQQLAGLLVLFVIIISAATYKTVTAKPVDPMLRDAQLAYELQKLELKQQNLKRYDALKFYGLIGAFGAINLSVLLVVGGIVRSKITQASVHVAHIGQHGAIPVHQKDLREFYQIAANLSLAEIEAAATHSHEQAYQISRQMIEDITEYTRAITGRRAGLFAGSSARADLLQSALPASSSVPTFADLLQNGLAAPGKPMVLGFHQGQPQLRSLKDLKSLAIAGWQGSGKTMSTAYIIASSVLAHGAQVYVVDPHKNHAEGLYALIKPLESTGHVHVINPFDTPTLIRNLEATLDRRLAGKEPSEPGILLVIDELASLAKMDCFDVLVGFLERCTEETRKANITFIGGSLKWTARHFKGRADIRGCMNSMLIHKTKPSQADLLLEDAHDKNLVKQIQRPGEAILSTDFSAAVLISMPFCARKDMETVAAMVKEAHGAAKLPRLDMETERAAAVCHDEAVEPETAVIVEPAREETTPENAIPLASKFQKARTVSAPRPDAKLPSSVIPFDLRRRKAQSNRAAAVRPDQLTLEQIHEAFQQRKMQEPNFTQAELARQCRISVGHLGNILRGQRPLTSQNKEKLFKILFLKENVKMPAISA